MTPKLDGTVSEISRPTGSSSLPTGSAVGDPILRDRRVVEHLSLVRIVALQVQARLPMHVNLEDLIHAGVIGLIAAASKFDPAKEVAFPSYAKHRIRGAILDDLRNEDWASRAIRNRHKQVAALNEEIFARFQRAPTGPEIAERRGVDLERWRKMALELRMVGLISATLRTKTNRV